MSIGAIEGIIWDIDGTLLDSMFIWDDLGARYLKKQNLQPEENLGEILYPMTLDESSTYLKTHYALPFSTEEIQKGVLMEIEDFYLQEVQLKPGVREFLEHLQKQKIPMLLATTGDERLAKAALTRLGIWDIFQGFLSTTQLHTSKHESLIYEEAARILQTSPQNTWVIEDTCYALQSAKQAGFCTLAIWDQSSAGQWEDMKELSDRAVKNFTELDFTIWK